MKIEDLQRRINNQRTKLTEQLDIIKHYKQLANQAEMTKAEKQGYKNDIDDLKASLEFTDANLSISEHERLKLQDTNKSLQKENDYLYNELIKLSDSYRELSRQEAGHKAKLVAINHAIKGGAKVSLR